MVQISWSSEGKHVKILKFISKEARVDGAFVSYHCRKLKRTDWWVVTDHPSFRDVFF